MSELVIGLKRLFVGYVFEVAESFLKSVISIIPLNNHAVNTISDNAAKCSLQQRVNRCRTKQP